MLTSASKSEVKNKQPVVKIPFILFREQRIEQIKATLPDLPIDQVNQTINDEWEQMTEEQKSQWQSQTNQTDQIQPEPEPKMASTSFKRDQHKETND